MKKRLTALALGLVMLLTLLPTAALGAEGGFVFNENGVLTRYNGFGGDVVIPDGVTVIGDSAFSHCSSLTSVTIPGSVTSIGAEAFFCCFSLTNVTIPGSVTSIGADAFWGCSMLTSVTIGNGVTSIGNSAFTNCGGLTSVTIPDSVTTIEEDAFSYCRSLISVTIPGSVTSIEKDVFSSCSSLTSITIPNSVTTIGDGAFLDCTSLTGVTIPDSVTSIGDRAFRGCRSLTDVTIPSSVTSIGRGTFDGCRSLTGVTIPDSVTSIGDYAFDGCDSLTSVTIPGGVTSIGDYAFEYCDSLTDVYYSGTEEQWKAIDIFGDNHPLWSATIHYNGPMPVGVAYPSTQSVEVDGRAVEFQMYALMDAENKPTNYVKLRDVASVLNGTAAQFGVGWDGVVNIKPGNPYVPNGSEMSTPFSGERVYTNPTAPTNIGGEVAALDAIVLTDDQDGAYTYYKLRDLGAALGFNVGWSAEKGVYIETDKPYDPNN